MQFVMLSATSKKPVESTKDIMMTRKLKYTCGTGDADYFITDGKTTVYLDCCSIFEAVFPVDEFDDIVDNCNTGNGIGTEEFKGFKIVETPKDTSTWMDLYETDEEYEAAVDW